MMAGKPWRITIMLPNKKEPKYIKHMVGQAYINKTREYLQYLEEHLLYVSLAFDELSEACDGTWWVGDDYTWHTLRDQIEHHDLSKFSPEEFVAYRKSFYPIDEQEKIESNFKAAWQHHKEYNHHHHETVETPIDLIHMIVDWTAMEYKFGTTAEQYYIKNKANINIPDPFYDIMLEIFDKLRDYRGKHNG